MNITLITASFNDEVHGTFNDKKTGCGINLQKPENVTRYRRSGQMTNMGEITCEKCKARIAKELIKADSKEMKAMLKEERLRAKRGIEDEGIVPLGNTTAKITSAQRVTQPEPEPQPIPAPEPPKPAYQPNGAPALNDDLAQFAIKRPEAEPAHDTSHQFVPEPQKLFDDEPEPPVQENDSVDDFLAQFAIQKPDDTQPEPEQSAEEDFLAQFAISAPPKEEPAPEPAAPPVIDDISAALAAMQQNPINPSPVSAPAPAPEPAVDDIMKMFSIDNQNNSGLQTSGVSAPAEYAVPEQSDEEISEWDLIANQLFGGENSEPVQPSAPVQPLAPVQPEIQQTVSAPAPAQPADIFEEPQYMKTPTGPKEMDELPSIDEILAEQAGKAAVYNNAPVQAQPVSAPVLDEIAPVHAQPVSAPVLDEIAPVHAQPVSAPVLDEIAPVHAQPVSAPVLNNIAPVHAQPVSAPVLDDIAFGTSYDERPVLEDIPEDEDDDELGFISEALEPKAPVLENISDAISAMNIPEAVQPKAIPVPNAVKPSAPVIDDISAALAALNAAPAPAPVQPAAPAPIPVQPAAPAPIPVQPVAPAPAPVQSVAPAPIPVQPVAPAPIPVQPVAPAPIPVQPVAPAPIPVQPVAPVQTAGAVGQIMSVPQITSYDAAGQPVYSYIQMQIQGYDVNGQPMLVPIAGQNFPAPNAPLTFNQTFNQNTRLRDAVAAAQEVPTSVKDMTPGQKIAAAEAAKGSPISANVSKIATNPHARSTSQAFISAISESKEYADKSLTETQGLQQRTVVLDSIEDVLSQLGDSSLKEKKAAEARANSVSVPQYDEYRPGAGASKRPYSPPPRTSSTSSMPSASSAPQRPLTRAEEKAMKKQAKIDAKFQKEMAKRK